MNDPFGFELEKKIEKSGVRKIFTPHAPVRLQELLFGRTSALREIISQVNTPGAYPILFGDRGVGKTSIASIVKLLVEHSKEGSKDVFIEMKRCSSKETLVTIFDKVLKRCGVDIDLIESSQTQESSGGAGVNIPFVKADIGGKRTHAEKFGPSKGNITPSKISELIGNKFEFGFLIIDETDAIEDENVKYALAEVVKLLSDSHSSFKIMLVGVAELASSLTAGHPSIGRCAVETKLDRMKDFEIRQIVTIGASRLKPAMDFDQDVVKKWRNLQMAIHILRI
jgi:hypothetical protein